MEPINFTTYPKHSDEAHLPDGWAPSQILAALAKAHAAQAVPLSEMAAATVAAAPALEHIFSSRCLPADDPRVLDLQDLEERAVGYLQAQVQLARAQLAMVEAATGFMQTLDLALEAYR